MTRTRHTPRRDLMGLRFRHVRQFSRHQVSGRTSKDDDLRCILCNVTPQWIALPREAQPIRHLDSCAPWERTVLALAMPFTMWLPCVLIFGLMLKKHTHWLALSAIALMVLATAVVPGFINAMLLADTLHPDVSPAAGKTSIFFYIWHVLFLASIVLWTAHVARNWLARRPSSPRQA